MYSRHSPHAHDRSPSASEAHAFGGIGVLGWLLASGAAVAMGAGIVLLEPAIAIVLPILLALCAYILYDYRAGVVGACFIVPLYETNFFPHQMFGLTGANPFNVLILATTGSYLLHRLQHRSAHVLLPKRLLWLYLFPIFLASLHGAWHVDEIPFDAVLKLGTIYFSDVPGYFRDNLLRPLLLIVFALLLGAAARESKRPERFVIPFVVSIWLLSGLMLSMAFLKTGGNPAEIATNRWLLTETVGIHANELGLLFNIAFAALLFSVGAVRGRCARLFYMASIGMVAVSVLITFSRAGLVGMALVSLLFLLSRRNFAVIVLGVILLGASIPLLPQAVRDRAMVGLRDENVDVVSAGRTDNIWLPLLDYAKESPVIGHGLAATLWSPPMKTDPTFGYGHAHNAYLNAFLDMGMLGLLSLGAFFALQWREFRQLGRQQSLSPLLRGVFQGAAVGIVVLFVQGLTDDRFTPTVSQIPLWFLIGMSFGTSERMLRPTR